MKDEVDAAHEDNTFTENQIVTGDNSERHLRKRNKKRRKSAAEQC